MSNLKKVRATNLFAIILALVFLASCKSSDNSDFENEGEEPSDFVEFNNPPAEGFNAAGSDAIAIILADQVMNAMGGRQKWDSTDVFYWNFFGNRTLLWDKETDRVRIDMPSQQTTIALDMSDMTGKVWVQGNEIADPDSAAQFLERGKRMWINDSYWLFMPFKLKDSGVTLKYDREDTLMTGEKADVLTLTFDSVGVTPQNGYEVWVDLDSRLVKQWAYFSDANQEEPNFVLPWTEYKEYNGLKLSGERGNRDITDIKVLNEVPAGAFDSPEPLNL